MLCMLDDKSTLLAVREYIAQGEQSKWYHRTSRIVSLTGVRLRLFGMGNRDIESYPMAVVIS